ncbi:rod shape-determining protein MreC [Desulfolutivibrio sp.]|uniref:rod shape-determining protein MreC n=1 Tax=Desulfolutivibrio sp. TaxID=2773296 RepID=UPI002F96A1CD
MDALASYTGLEFAKWVLAPGKWAASRVSSFWDRYVYFVGVREENDSLRASLAEATQELGLLREKAAEAERLARILTIRPPVGWSRQGARVISHRLGPNAALETVLLDKGALDGLEVNTPVTGPDGVIGRLLRLSPTAATVLLVTDPNSRIPVTSQKNRTQGIIKGEGANREMVVQYVALGAPLEEGELLVTSGLEEIFPKGLPVARVTEVGRKGPSLFQTVYAEPLFDARRLEEVALLAKNPQEGRVQAEPGPGGVAEQKEPVADPVSHSLSVKVAPPDPSGRAPGLAPPRPAPAPGTERKKPPRSGP